MSTVADMTKRMLELGASPEVIAIAVDAVTLASRDSHAPSRSVTRDKVKEQARVRQKRRRDKLAAQRQLSEAQANDGATDSVTVTRDAVRDERDDATTLLSSLSLNLEGSTEEGSKKNKKARSENARATRMQVGAVLTETDRTAAIELGADPDRVDAMWAEFVDYWTGIPGQRGTKLGERGWSGTWRNRVRMIVTKGNGNGSGPHQNRTSATSRSAPTGQDAILAGMGRIADRVRARGDAERRERELREGDDAAGGADARLL